jgi:hypothetical protein
MVQRDTPRPGPCLLCSSENDYSYPDLPHHLRTQHGDMADPVAELMIQMGQLKNQVKGLSTRT